MTNPISIPHRKVGEYLGLLHFSVEKVSRTWSIAHPIVSKKSGLLQVITLRNRELVGQSTNEK
jgi:hypothetical protein